MHGYETDDGYNSVKGAAGSAGTGFVLYVFATGTICGSDLGMHTCMHIHHAHVHAHTTSHTHLSIYLNSAADVCAVLPTHTINHVERTWLRRVIGDWGAGRY